jgi:hypothetical protein
VDDEEQIVLELQYDALSHAPDAGHQLSRCLTDWRIEGAEKKRFRDARPLQTLSDQARLERFYIDGDVRQLGHVLILSSPWRKPIIPSLFSQSASS